MSDERITVTFRLYGLGRGLGHSGGSALSRSYAPGATVGEALRDLGIVHEAEVSVLIDGRVVSAERSLEPGDELIVVPPLVGGNAPRTV
jgi:sulfur carrier protein ThiS